MRQRRRRIDQELLLLLFLPACGLASLVVALVLAALVPVAILPAVAQSIPTPTRILLPPTFTPSPTPSPSPTNTREPLTPSPTPATPTLTRTPTEIPLNGITGLAVYTRTNNVWVTNSAGNSVSEVDAKDPDRVLFTLRDISSPGEIAIWQTRGLAYIANPTRNTVTEIDLVARRVSGTFPVGVAPTRLTIDQSSGDVYVITSIGTSLSIIFAKTRSVSPILWEHSAVDVAWYGVPSSVLVANQDGTGQIYSQNGAGDPIKIGSGLDSIAIRSAALNFAATSRVPTTSVYITSPANQGVFGVTGTVKFYGLKRRPRAIANMERCIGVVLPEENSLATLDYDLTHVTALYQVGEQGVEGGNGLAYNPILGLAYVANHAANSITLIPNPCPSATPTPTRLPIPFFPTFQIPLLPFVTATPPPIR